MRTLPFASAASAVAIFAAPALGQERGMGKPPADATALIDAPKGAPKPPEIEKQTDGASVTLSSGGQLATGNSRLLAGTANGALDARVANNGLSFALLANYGQGAPPGQQVRVTAENAQGRLRYDRYVSERLAAFLIDTFRHDRLQGLDVRYNLDPGLQFLLVKDETSGLWVDAGYDFQGDVRRADALIVLGDNGAPVIDPSTGRAQTLARTATDHSWRLLIGGRHAFNREVNFSAGIEYLQSVVEAAHSRVNVDALFAAKVSGGLAVGLGFSARYDHSPLPRKEHLDTATTLTLIYSYSRAPGSSKVAGECK